MFKRDKLKGEVAIVTGGGSGIGKAVCLKLAEYGAIVAVIDLVIEKAEAVVKEIEKLGNKSLAIRTDISKKNEVEQMVSRVVREYGKVEILVNSAGILTFTSFIDTSEDEWNRVIDVNLKGTFLCSKEIASFMIKAKRGKIINIGSVSSRGFILNNALGSISYCVSKAGVHCLTRMLAGELAPYNINVNTIAPGTTDTPMHKGHIEEFKRKYLKWFPLGRFAVPNDIANVVLFLVCDEAKYITGQALHVNGGLIMVN